MMRAFSQKSLALLLAFSFCMMAGWKGSLLLAAQPSPNSQPSCHCCKPDADTCAVPACCARPSGERSPLTPVAPPSAPGQEWHAIPQASATLFTLPRSTLNAFLTGPTTPASAGAVPIFQRNCSFLL